MSAQSDKLTQELLKSPLDKQIAFAEMVRAAYISQVANTQRVLNPKELRELDEGIALLKLKHN